MGEEGRGGEYADAERIEHGRNGESVFTIDLLLDADSKVEARKPAQNRWISRAEANV